MPYTYEYPRPAVTIDCIVICKKQSSYLILLIQRKNNPFINKWALPGGFIDIDEELEDSVKRELFEETGITINSIKQFHTYGTIGRDPRGRTISVVYYGFVDNESPPSPGDDAKNAKWFDILNLPELAFDHNKIIEDFKKEVLKI